MILCIYKDSSKIFRLDFGNLNIAHPYKWKRLNILGLELAITFGKLTKYV